VCLQVSTSATWLCETLKWVSPRDLGVRHTKLKWRHLFFWYTLFWFDLLVPHFQSKRNSHHKFSMWRINNEIVWSSFIQRFIHFYTWIPCVENMVDTWINVLMNEIQTYEWMNVTQILHRPINSCVKCVFNAWNVWIMHEQILQDFHYLVMKCLVCDGKGANPFWFFLALEYRTKRDKKVTCFFITLNKIK